jgi:membrane associated rhomboid family serine protease
MDFATAPAAFGILGLTIAVSLLGLLSAPRILERNLLRPYWLIKQREYSTVITCGFIHADFGHLLFNSLTLYFFGPNLERTIGTTRFVALYFVGLLISSLGTVYKHRRNPNYASLGASGAILAVLFAFIVYYPTHDIYFFFIPVGIPAPIFAVLYLGYTWWASKNSQGRVNHDAHLDGALTGLLFVAVTDFGAWHDAFEQIF